ncbi:MAG: hypothetical protein IJR49_06420, partial [Treponema sp.]|nr:hypothetical protein [Treponema sp.]
AGIASADTFESAYDEEDVYEMQADAVAEAAPRMMAKTAATGVARANATKDESFMNVNQTVTTSSVQDEMFSFTPVNPVTINRQESIMIPLVVNAIPAEKFSVFSNMTLQKEVHPKLCIRIENKTDMKFPAGPVSVLSSGTYSGDAMLDFLPAGEKRIIGFGDDMEVSGSLTRSTERNVETVKIINGILKITTRRNYDSVYTIKNASAISKSIIVEHPITNGRELLNSKDVFEKTANKYRFKIEVAQKQNKKITVQEKESAESSYALSRMSYADFISYSTNSEMPSKVKKTFSEIASRKSKVENARSEFNKLVEEQKNLSIEQERVRKNLEALGSTSVQGKQFLDKLMSLENELDLLKKKIALAQENLSKLEKDFSDYIAKVSV